MRSWSNICRKKSNAVAEVGGGVVGPTSSVKGCMEPKSIAVGVSLLGNLYGIGVRVTRALEVVPVELLGSPLLVD